MRPFGSQYPVGRAGAIFLVELAAQLRMCSEEIYRRLWRPRGGGLRGLPGDIIASLQLIFHQLGLGALAAALSFSPLPISPHAFAGTATSRVAFIFSTIRCAFRIVGSFDSGGKPRARRPPGIFAISPRSFAAFMRSSQRRRPSSLAAREFGCSGVPGGRPLCRWHRVSPDRAGLPQRPPLRLRALQ